MKQCEKCGNDYQLNESTRRTRTNTCSAECSIKVFAEKHSK